MIPRHFTDSVSSRQFREFREFSAIAENHWPYLRTREQSPTHRPSGLEHWTGDRTIQGSNPTAENFSLRNFANSVYPALPVSFGGDTKSRRRRSLLSGVYARGSKRSHQSALECVTLVDYIAHSKLPQKCVYTAENAALH